MKLWSRSQLIKNLQEELDAAYEFMQELLEENILPDDLLREYSMGLTLLQNKHIPAEVCSEGKLMERLLEVETWVGDVKHEIAKTNTDYRSAR